MIGIITILIMVRVLQYTVYLPTFGPIVRSLANTLKDPSVLSFIVLLLFLLMGFTLAIRTGAANLEETNDYPRTFTLLFILMVGQFPNPLFMDTITRLALLLVLIFVVLMSVIFVNMFISVLSEVSQSV